MTVRDDRDAGGGDPSSQGHREAKGADRLARLLSELARDLEGETDTEGTLAQVVSSAVDLVPGAVEGSISVVLDRVRVESHAPSGELPARVDQLQEQLQEGPCLSAVFEQQTVRVDDLRTETRWPAFAQQAVAAGASSMLAFQLYVEGNNLGALNLYGAQAGAFDEESEHVGLLFAAHAAVAFAAVRKQEQLTQAVATRDLIGQAKGILMERYGLSSDRAFSLLTRVSRTTNRKLRDVAEELATTGQLHTIAQHDPHVRPRVGPHTEPDTGPDIQSQDEPAADGFVKR